MFRSTSHRGTAFRFGSSVSRRLTTAAATALLALGAVQPAMAGFTQIIPNKYGEPAQGAILSHALGGDFVASGENFSNGTITATRVDDNDDQIWDQSIISSQVVAAFNFLPQVVGYFPGTTGGTFTPLFAVHNDGYDAIGSGAAVPISGPYRLARSGWGDTFTSVPTDNADQQDHLVTYAITGLPGEPPNVYTWMLFWEDMPAPFADWDFNDLVVKLQTDPPAPKPPLLIPLPPAAWSGLSGLAALLMVGGIARARRRLA